MMNSNPVYMNCVPIQQQQFVAILSTPVHSAEDTGIKIEKSPDFVSSIKQQPPLSAPFSSRPVDGPAFYTNIASERNVYQENGRNVQQNPLDQNLVSSMSKDKWPESLKAYVNACFEKCRNDIDKDQVEIFLKVKLVLAHHDGSFFIKDWSKEPLLRIHSERLEMEQKTADLTNQPLKHNVSPNSPKNDFQQHLKKCYSSPRSRSFSRSRSRSRSKSRTPPRKVNRKKRSVSYSRSRSRSKSKSRTPPRKVIQEKRSHSRSRSKSRTPPRKFSRKKRSVSRSHSRSRSRLKPRTPPRKVVRKRRYSRSLSRSHSFSCSRSRSKSHTPPRKVIQKKGQSRYPDPGIQQVNESKLLHMDEKLQEDKCDSGEPINAQQKDLEKINSMYEHFERPFKQIKFSADGEKFISTFLPISTDVLQPSVEQFRFNKQDAQNLSKSKQACRTPPLNEKKELHEKELDEKKELHEKELDKKKEPCFQIKDIFITKEIEDRIISALGLPFIQDFAEKIKACVTKFSKPIPIIQWVCFKLGMKKDFHFETNIDPDMPNYAAIKYSKCFIKNCEIASGTSLKTKEAKELSAEASINTIVKLSTSTFNRVKSHNSVNEHRRIVHSTVHRITDSMKVLEIFKRNIINRAEDEPAIVALKSIASLVHMEDYIAFKIVSNIVSPTVTEYTCNFFLNDILISHGKGNTSQSAKNIAADLGLMKLSNLAEYEIQNGKLKKKNPGNEAVCSVNLDINRASFDVETNNFGKTSFVFNKILFDSSVKDGFLLIERDKFKTDFQKDLRSLLVESANFCKKRFEYLFEDVLGTIPPSKRAIVLIGGKVVGVGVAFLKDDAKTIACSRAFNDLRKKYYTLRVKDSAGFMVTRNQVFEGESYTKNNLECSKLKKICYTGNDDKGQNINNPTEVTIEQPSSMEIGSKTGEQYHNLYLFKLRIEAMLREFSESEDYCDLLFLDKFNAVEKLEIKRNAKKFHLRPLAFKVDDSPFKYTCVRHKSNVSKLLNYLAKNKGYNCKYELTDGSVTE